MAKKSNRVKQESTIDDIIDDIKQKSADGDYIYRGERQPHCKVSSALYRKYFNDEKPNVDFEDFDFEHFDMRIIQKAILNAAKKHIGEPPKHIEIETRNRNAFEGLARTLMKHQTSIINTTEVEILTELQHYGSKTNLIDFTTDYLISIFFACTDHFKEEGRVILLQKTKEIENMIIRPYNPRHRVIAQKSVFLHPSKGFVDVPDDDIVTIPAYLKQPLLEYLRKYHNIAVETIYNDIHGFIKNEKIHQNFLKDFYLGLMFHYKGHDAETPTEKQKAYKRAISYYDSSIVVLGSGAGAAFDNRGECWLHLGEWCTAIGNSDHSLKEDCATIPTSLKGVSEATPSSVRYLTPMEFQRKTLS